VADVRLFFNEAPQPLQRRVHCFEIVQPPVIQRLKALPPLAPAAHRRARSITCKCLVIGGLKLQQIGCVLYVGTSCYRTA